MKEIDCVRRQNLKPRVTFVKTRERTEQEEQDRFWSYVEKKGPGDCWNWIGHVNGVGYGEFRLNDRTQEYAQTISWIYSGKDIPEGHQVFPICKNKLCCNPEHMYTTYKWESISGENSYSAKLTKEQVEKIRIMYSTGRYTQKELALKFGIGSPRIHYILTGQKWKHQGIPEGWKPVRTLKRRTKKGT